MPTGVYIRTEEILEIRRKSSKRGINHPMWKGDKATYRAKHIWIERILGKPHECKYCGDISLSHRKYHWSNISGNYLRDVNDWIRLCAKCHKIHDIKIKKSYEIT